jgi:hypothetical protein
MRTISSITDTETPLDNLNADGVFFGATQDCVVVKPEGSAWIDSETLTETSFRCRDMISAGPKG